MIRDISISRAKPAIRLTRVRPPIVPVALTRFMGLGREFSGVADRRFAFAAWLTLRLLGFHLSHIRGAEVDWV